MVEAVETPQVYFKVVEGLQGNLHRTLNLAAKYGKTRPVFNNAGGARWRAMRKQIMPCEAALGKEKKIVMGWTKPEGSVKRIEAVGKAYDVLMKKYMKLAEVMKAGGSAQFEDEVVEEVKRPQKEGAKGKKGSEDDDDEEEEKDGEDHGDTEAKRHTKTKAQIEKEALDGNLYGVLEMVDKTYDANEKEITKAYRKMALRYHPDKLGENITEKDKKVWLKIAEAYDTLMDPAKRRTYDSSLPFDEKIPEVPEGQEGFTEEEFYEKFTACFNLNMRWSTKQPTPNFGCDATPLAKVKQFYKFWDDFKSWREFSQYNEYDTAEAQDRYEKRYM